MNKFKVSILFLFLITALTACDQRSYITEDESRYKIYYLNSSRTGLVGEPYTPKETEKEELIAEFLRVMSGVPKNLSYKKALPDTVTIKEYKISDDKELTINFDSNYSTLTGVSEILCRIAIIKTLCQIEGVNYVGFYMEDQSIIDSSGQPVTLMSAEDIIDNTGGENAIVTLFFADKKGDNLLQKRVRVNYDGTIPLEQVIIEQLIRGPSSIEGINETKVFATLPEDTALEKTTTKGGICSVYFNKKFLNKFENITEEVQIYSVVNSLIELSSINKVQFYIDGKLVETFKEYKDFDALFERNLDIIE